MDGGQVEVSWGLIGSCLKAGWRLVGDWLEVGLILVGCWFRVVGVDWRLVEVEVGEEGGRCR